MELGLSFSKARLAAVLLVCIAAVIAPISLGLIPHYLIGTLLITIILILIMAQNGLLSFPLVLYVIIVFPAFTPLYAWDLRGKNYFSRAALELQDSVALVNETVWVFAVAALAYYAATLIRSTQYAVPSAAPVFVIDKIPAMVLGCLLIGSAYVIDPGPTILSASYTEILAGRFETSQGTIIFELVMGGLFVSLFLFGRQYRWVFWTATLIAFTWLLLHVRRVEFFGLLLVMMYWMRTSLNRTVTIAILLTMIVLLGLLGEVRNKGLLANFQFFSGLDVSSPGQQEDDPDKTNPIAMEHEVGLVGTKAAADPLNGPSGGELRIAQKGRHIESFEFADGSVLPLEALTGDQVSAIHSKLFPALSSGGRPALNKVNGTAADDVLKGTPADDHILGLSGRDEIVGGKGDDILDAGKNTAGWQRLSGGEGDDVYQYSKQDRLVFIPAAAENAESGNSDRVVFKDLNLAELNIDYYDYGDGPDGKALRLSWGNQKPYTKAALPGGASNVFLSGLHLVNIRVNQLIPASQMWTMVEWIKGLVPGSLYGAVGIAPARSEHETIYQGLNLDYLGGMPLVSAFFLNGGYVLVLIFGILHGLAGNLMEQVYQRQFVPNRNMGGSLLTFAVMVFLFYQFRYQWYNPQSPIRAMEFGLLLYFILRFGIGFHPTKSANQPAN